MPTNSKKSPAKKTAPKIETVTIAKSDWKRINKIIESAGFLFTQINMDHIDYRIDIFLRFYISRANTAAGDQLTPKQIDWIMQDTNKLLSCLRGLSDDVSRLVQTTEAIREEIYQSIEESNIFRYRKAKTELSKINLELYPYGETHETEEAIEMAEKHFGLKKAS